MMGVYVFLCSQVILCCSLVGAELGKMDVLDEELFKRKKLTKVSVLIFKISNTLLGLSLLPNEMINIFQIVC